MKNKLSICIPVFSIFFMASCSVVGSWAFERIDHYLASYLEKYADFSEEQKVQIGDFAQDYENWVAQTHLSQVKSILKELKTINKENSGDLILRTYDYTEDLVESTNHFFEFPFVQFSKTLSDKQIKEIKEHLSSIEEDEEDEIKGANVSYSEILLERYISGFRKINIKLDANQQNIIREGVSEMQDLRARWRFFRDEWIEGLIKVLGIRNELTFEEELISHLAKLGSLGDVEFRLKLTTNREVTKDILSKVFAGASEKQLKNFRKRLDTYIASIDRVLARRAIP